MSEDLPVVEGYIPFKGHRVWYRIVGEEDTPGKLPLLTLHGGPGAAHDYLESLDAVARTGRRVIYYDQLGCGRSATPPNPSMWTVDLYKEEIEVIRGALGLGHIHLLGQSWGGMLAMEYAISRPVGVAALIVASSPASMVQWVAEANRLRNDLPPDVQATLRAHEVAGTTTDPAYEAAVREFYKRHVCRVDPFPEFVERTFAAIAANPEVYHTMNGPSEFHVIGTLKNWDVVSELGKIRIPTLVTSGRYDEATPLIAETVHRGIPGSEWVLFEHSSHMAHAEEPERYVQVLDHFLDRIEADL